MAIDSQATSRELHEQGHLSADIDAVLGPGSDPNARALTPTRPTVTLRRLIPAA
jgi:hypothetical protein